LAISMPMAEPLRPVSLLKLLSWELKFQCFK